MQVGGGDLNNSQTIHKEKEKEKEQAHAKPAQQPQNAENEHYLKRRAEVRQLKKDLGLEDSVATDEDMENMIID